jgi:hypothetical protein
MQRAPEQLTIMSKSTIIQNQTQRAAQMVERQNSFIQANYWLWVVVAYIFYPAASILSALTEGAHVVLNTTSALPFWLAMFVAFLVIVLIEGTKFLCGKGLVDDIQADVFGIGGPRLSMFFVKVLGFIAAMTFSVILSLNVMPKLTKMYTNDVAPVESILIPLDSIEAKYNAEILPHQDAIDKLEQTTWKGKITRTANKSISASQGLIAGIEARKDAALQAAREENQQLKAEYLASMEEAGKYNTGFAGLAEAICAFCLLFIGLFDQGVKDEVGPTAASSRRSASSGPMPQQQIGFQQAANTDQQINEVSPTPRRPIGFHQHSGPTTSASGASQVVATSSYQPDASNPVAADIYKSAYAKAKADRDSWLAKNPATEEGKQTQQKRVAEKEGAMQFAKAQLHAMGLDIELKGRRFRLVPHLQNK